MKNLARATVLGLGAGGATLALAWILARRKEARTLALRQAKQVALANQAALARQASASPNDSPNDNEALNGAPSPPSQSGMVH